MQWKLYGQLFGSVAWADETTERCADEAGQFATMATSVSDDSTRTAAAATRTGMCLMYTGRQAGWDAVLAVVYDDVCGKQAIECWMQASAQKQEVKRGTTQQTRQGERVRSTMRGVELRAADYILRRIIAKQCKWLRGSCARGKRRWRGRGWRLSRCAGKHFMLA
jgi:hypothetical protein